MTKPPFFLSTDSTDYKLIKKRILVVTVAAFIMTALLGISIVVVVEKYRYQKKQITVDDLTSRVAGNIHDHLGHSLSVTYALAAIIRQNNGHIDNFETLATEMLGQYGGISSLALAPHGVVSSIVPLAGNEKAIGHNLLEDVKRNKEALLALKTRKLTLAGPFGLVQGGRAVIGRLPVFIPAENGTDHFWGFVAVVVRIPVLMNSANLQNIVSSGYHYELSRIHPDSGKRDVFERSTGIALSSPIGHAIEVPNGSWTLSIGQSGGWFSPLIILGELMLVLLVSALTSLMLYELLKKPQILQKLVKERTAELLGERLRLANIIAGTKAGTWEWNVQTGETVFNEQWAGIIGYTLDEISPGSIETRMKFAHPDDLQKSGELLEEHFRGELEYYEYEYRMKHKNGQWVWVQDRGKVASLSDDGKPLWMFGTHQDITERKRGEEELRHARQTAIEASLAKSHFLAVVAHEFYTPLHLLTISTDILEQYRGHLSAEEQDEQLDQIQNAALQLTSLIDSVSVYGRQERLVNVPELLDIRQTCATISNEIDKVWGKDHITHAAISPDCGTGLFKEALFRRLLGNLLTNAYCFTPAGGSVSLSVKREGDRLLIEVADTGIGISEEDQARVFEAFYRSSNVDARRGLGLGLSIVNDSLLVLNGSISLKSKVGEGTTFNVELPIVSNSVTEEQSP